MHTSRFLPSVSQDFQRFSLSMCFSYLIFIPICVFLFFFLNDPAPPEFSPLPLPAPLPILDATRPPPPPPPPPPEPCGRPPPPPPPADQHHNTRPAIGLQDRRGREGAGGWEVLVAQATAPAATTEKFREKAHAASINPSVSLTDRKSTRLNSSHLVISYAVFCLKKKKIYTI